MKDSIMRKSFTVTSFTVACIVLGGFIRCCGAQGNAQFALISLSHYFYVLRGHIQNEAPYHVLMLTLNLALNF